MNNTINKKKLVLEYATIIVGTLLMSTGINMFYSPSGLVTGGVTGIAIVLETLTSGTSFYMPIWLTNIVANVPLFLLGIKVFGMKKLAKTAFATVFMTVALYATSFLPSFTGTDFVLTSVFGATLGGIGLGLVFRTMATTGGSDMAASLIHTLALPHISISKIMFCIDAVVITLGFFIFGPEKGMYAIISAFIYSKIVDAIQEGLSFAKAAFIISENSVEIAAVIMDDIDRGVTGLFGKGMYTQKDKNVLLCVVSSKEIVRIKALVHQIDQNAFLIVADVREVMGKGFAELA